MRTHLVRYSIFLILCSSPIILPRYKLLIKLNSNTTNKALGTTLKKCITAYSNPAATYDSARFTVSTATQDSDPSHWTDLMSLPNSNSFSGASPITVTGLDIGTYSYVVVKHYGVVKVTGSAQVQMNSGVDATAAIATAPIPQTIMTTRAVNEVGENVHVDPSGGVYVYSAATMIGSVNVSSHPFIVSQPPLPSLPPQIKTNPPSQKKTDTQ